MMGVCGPSAAGRGHHVTYCTHVGTMFVAAALSIAPRITYLSSHLCLRVCALSSPFVPYHGVLVCGLGGCVALAGTDVFVVFPLLYPR